MTSSRVTIPTTYAYDADGRLVTIDSPQGTLHYQYDDLGRKTAAHTGDAATGTGDATTATLYGYDAMGRLISVTAGRQFGANVSNQTTKYVYDKAGRIDFELLPLTGGSYVTKDYVYDALGRVSSIAHFTDGDGDRAYDSGGGETLFDKFDYTYFLDGSRESETRTNADGTTTVEWTYDGLNRLVSEEFSGLDGQGDPLAYTDTYSFDLSSNRAKLVHDDTTGGGGGGPGSAGPDATTTYEYDANDRLLAETKDVAGGTTGDRHTVYGYGPTDQTGKTVHDGLDDTGTVVEDIDFVYDATARMTGVTMAVGSTSTTVTYKYDASGFRVEATVDDGTNPPVTTVFHVDPNNPTGYIQVVEEGVDADGDGRLDAAEIEKAFVLGMDVLTQAAASLLAHLLYDAHGTTKAILNAATSSVVERYVYSAYGIDLGLASSPLTSLRYAGEYIDPISGLSFNRARWYALEDGRFTRRDSWPGRPDRPVTFNGYIYAEGNPIGLVDPSGFISVTDVLSATAIILIVAALLPGPLDFVQSVAENLVGAYSVNLEWDVNWATNWDLPNDLHSRADNSWIAFALMRGVYDAFTINIPFTGQSFNPLDSFGDSSHFASRVSNGGRINRRRLTGRLDGVSGLFSARLRIEDAQGNWHSVGLYRHTGINRRLVIFSDASIKHQVTIRPTGVSRRDIAAANKAMGKPARYDWRKEFGEPHTWHHDYRRGVMQLVPRYVHENARHYGGDYFWYRYDRKDGL